VKKLSTQISIRLVDEDLAQLKRLEKALGGVTSRSNLARAAMRVGLTVLEKRPALLVSAVDEPDRRAAALEAAGTFVDAVMEERIAKRVVKLHGATLRRLAK
jgi:hypothetical protein